MDGTPQTVTSRREADGWYATFSCDQVPLKPLPVTGHEPGHETGHETGLDLGIASFATLATGKPVDNPRVFRGWEMQIKRAQRRGGRRTKGSKGSKGSKRRRTAVTRLAQAHHEVRRARQDVHHQTARTLVQAYDAIEHASLPVATRLTNHQLAKASADVAGSTCLRTLTFTAAEAGKQVVAGTPAFTAQACSGGGALVLPGLSVRWQEGPDGGTRLQRDQNAALTILKRGQACVRPGRPFRCQRRPLGQT